MTKSVVIALIYFLIFCGIYCNEFSIKLVKIAQKVDLTSGATRKSHMRSTCWMRKS